MKKLLFTLMTLLVAFTVVTSVSAYAKTNNDLNRDSDHNSRGDDKKCVIGWNITQTWDMNLNITGDSTLYLEVADITQTGTALSGSFTYNGGSKWDISTGSVVGNNVNFDVFYDTNPSMIAHFTGVIASNGTITGTWADTAGLTRTGTWSTAGKATPVMGKCKDHHGKNENNQENERDDSHTGDDNHSNNGQIQ